jgi:hypothetical protein
MSQCGRGRGGGAVGEEWHREFCSHPVPLRCNLGQGALAWGLGPDITGVTGVQCSAFGLRLAMCATACASFVSPESYNRRPWTRPGQMTGRNNGGERVGEEDDE